MEHKAWHIKALIDTFSKSEWRIVDKCMSAEWWFDRQWWASGFQGKTNLVTDPCHCQSTGSIFSLGNRRLCPARTCLVLTAPFLNASLTSGEQAVALTAPSTHALCRALPWAAHPFQSLFFGILQNLAPRQAPLCSFRLILSSSVMLVFTDPLLVLFPPTHSPWAAAVFMTMIANHYSQPRLIAPDPYVCFPAEISN